MVKIMEIVVVLVIVAAMAGLTYRAVTAFLIRGELDTARRENERLKARRAALRDDAFSLGARATERIERAHRLPISAGRGPDTPSPNAGDDSIIAWLSSKGAQLQALSVDLSHGEATAGAERRSITARHGAGAASLPGDDARQAAESRSAGSRSVGKAAE